MQRTLVAAALLFATTAFAQTLPDGWASNSDGGYVHHDSGVACVKAIGTYTLTRLDGAAPPGTLGVCVYSGGDVRVGEIRVRKFVDGQGDTPLAIQNDRGLMGLVPSQAGTKPVATYRVGPGPQIDGAETVQVVMTFALKGLLIDCISQTKRDSAEVQGGFGTFITPCLSSGSH